jgi:hypothetical protein
VKAGHDVHEIAGHRQPHIAESDESDRRHECDPSAVMRAKY